jgi:2-oxoglutarate dehydrogenase E1 component
MHIQDPTQRTWVQSEVEAPYQKPSPREQREILSTLVRAEAFEAFFYRRNTRVRNGSPSRVESL